MNGPWSSIVVYWLGKYPRAAVTFPAVNCWRVQVVTFELWAAGWEHSGRSPRCNLSLRVPIILIILSRIKIEKWMSLMKGNKSTVAFHCCRYWFNCVGQSIGSASFGPDSSRQDFTSLNRIPIQESNVINPTSILFSGIVSRFQTSEWAWEMADIII